MNQKTGLFTNAKLETSCKNAIVDANKSHISQRKLTFEVFEKLTCACYIQIALKTMLLPILINSLLLCCLGAQVDCMQGLRLRVLGANRYSLHVHVQDTLLIKVCSYNTTVLKFISTFIGQNE
jgi:hypothetical protein